MLRVPRCVVDTAYNVSLYAMYPRELPDVFAGSEIVLVGRFDGSCPLTARLLGRQGNEPVNHTFETAFDAQRERYSFIPKLWAGRRIGHLLEQMRRSGETDETKEEIIRLSKKYGIMTPYTAFLAAPEAVRITQSGGGQPHGIDAGGVLVSSGAPSSGISPPRRSGPHRPWPISTGFRNKPPATSV